MKAEQEPRTRVVKIVIFVFLIILLSYALFQARHLIFGPIITIKSPDNGDIVSESSVTIQGSARNISHINLNDRPIFINEDGQFEEQLLLPHGYTIMTLEVEDRFGRKTQKTLQLVRN